MYTCDSLKKYRTELDKALEWYAKFPAESLKICVSTGNNKIGNALNVSLPPIVTCGKNCKYCMEYCYDIKACLQYENVIMARARNYSILLRNFRLYWNQIRERMKHRRTDKYFRFHVAGDIISEEYLKELIKTAKMFPDFTIWTYTKQYDIVNEYVRKHGNSRRKAIPANLSIMFSEWDGLEMKNPYNFPVFKCVFRGKDKPPKNMWHCPGNCDICKREHRGCVAGESSWVWDH